ncbi:MAG: hypothetical protein QXJ12_01465, partial [Candidatus Parvarchaeota archaeon]|nr:SufD family Fe-S cluster assembly protein [Candidatus Parvarchaeota archaeon]
MADLFKSYIDMKLGALSIPSWLADYKRSEFKRFRELPFEVNPLFKKEAEIREKLLIDEESILDSIMNSKLEGSVEYTFERKGSGIEERDILSDADDELLKGLIMRENSPADKLQCLNNALFATGKFVYISDRGAGDMTVTERTTGAFEISKDVFYVGRGAKARLSLRFENERKDARVYKNIDVFVEEGGNLDILMFQRLGSDAIVSINLDVYAGGNVNLVSVDDGGGKVRYRIYAGLLKEGIAYDQNSIMIGRKTKDADVVNLVTH